MEETDSGTAEFQSVVSMAVGRSAVSEPCGKVQRGLRAGLDGRMEPVGQRGRDKNTGTKCAEAPGVDMLIGSPVRPAGLGTVALECLSGVVPKSKDAG